MPAGRSPSGAPACLARVLLPALAAALVLIVPERLPAAAGVDRLQPAVAVVIDDLGDGLAEGMRALRLPGAVTYAFLPHTPYGRGLAATAHERGKQVMLHLPMQSQSGHSTGAGALTLPMTRTQLGTTLFQALRDIPHVSGLNNHMGSLLTRHPGHMRWLMEELRQYGKLFFVDSRTTEQTVAHAVAIEHGIPVTSRDVFLDNVRAPAAINAQFDRLLWLARRYGTALAIGHPHPETLAVLEARLPDLTAQHIRLVQVSNLITLQKAPKQLEPRLWQTSLSRSPRAARSWKPSP